MRRRMVVGAGLAMASLAPLAALPGLPGSGSALANQRPRTLVRNRYRLGFVQDAAEAKAILSSLKGRLDDLGLVPRLWHLNDEILVEIRRPPDGVEIETVLTSPGVLTGRRAASPRDDCKRIMLKGMVCYPSPGSEKPFMMMSQFPEFDNRDIASARAGDRPGELQITCTEDGRERLENFTRRRLKRRIAFVIDDVVVFSPRVQEIIRGGTAVILGGDLNARTWAAIISHPPLPRRLALLGVERVGSGN